MDRRTFLIGSVAAPLGATRKISSSPKFVPGLSALVPIVEKRVVAVEADLKRPKPTVSVRNLPNGALTLLMLEREPARAEALLQQLFALQDTDEQSPHYGEVPWQMNHPEINDRNADMFCSQALGPILTAYGEKLSADCKRALGKHAQGIFAALRRRQFRQPAYTNIYVMRAVNLILLGEAVQDTDAASEGYRQLDDWLRYTATSGVHEFNSPTYTAVDLNSLYLGYRFAKQAEARAKFRAILDYFWTDICANYFAGRGSYAGPHSRDYDFVGGWNGGIGYYLAAYGLKNDGSPNMVDLEKIYPIFNSLPGNYRPSPDILTITARPKRVIRSRWDSVPNKDRYHYVTPEFAIGGATGDYSGEDKLITVELASGKRLPVIAVVPDTSDSPYGKVKRADKSGHDKPFHLPLGPVCVQEQGTLLALLGIDATKTRDPAPPTIATNILIPAKADRLVLDGKPVDLTRPGQIDAKIGSVLGVLEGKAGVAIRLIAADGVREQTPMVVLQSDPDSLADGAARWSIYHYRGTPEKPDASANNIGVALLIVAERCADTAAFTDFLRRVGEAPISEKRNGSSWQVEAHVGGRTLTVGRDPATKSAVRQIDGVDLPAFPPLTVDGEDIFARLLSRYVAPTATTKST